MSNVELYNKIRACDTGNDYVFISYSSHDSEYVFEDVCHLQNLGYNIWIDKNLKETDDSWKSRALDAIEDPQCKLVMFYMSRSSVVSEPCIEELRHTRSIEAKKFHNLGQDVPWLAIEVDTISSVEGFFGDVYNEVNQNESDKDKKKRMLGTCFDFKNEFFPDEDKIRIKSRLDDSKRYDYYDRIIENLGSFIEIMSAESVYKNCFNRLSDKEYTNTILNDLSWCAGAPYDYVPAKLMLAFIYKTGIIGGFKEQMYENCIWDAEMSIDDSDGMTWSKMADECAITNRKAEAIAFYLGSALKNKSAKDYANACRCLMKMDKPSLTFTIKCAEGAANLGDAQCAKLLSGLRMMTEEKFLEYVSRK